MIITNIGVLWVSFLLIFRNLSLFKHVQILVAVLRRCLLCSMSDSLWLLNRMCPFLPPLSSSLLLLHFILSNTYKKCYCSFLHKQKYHFWYPGVLDLTSVPKILPLSTKLPLMLVPLSCFLSHSCLCPVSQAWLHEPKTFSVTEPWDT